MRVLVAGGKNTPDAVLASAVVAVRATLEANGAKDVQIVCPSGPRWEEVRRMEGSWDAMYAWAVRSHDAVILVPQATRDDGAVLSRGCYQMAEGALAVGKTVVIVESGVLRKIVSVSRAGMDSWKDGYGMGVLA